MSAQDFRSTKLRNEMLRQNLYDLVSSGNQDSTEIRLLRDALDAPGKPVHQPDKVHKVNPLKESNGIVNKAKVDDERFTKLRESINKIKNSRYKLPSDDQAPKEAPKPHRVVNLVEDKKKKVEPLSGTGGSLLLNKLEQKDEQIGKLEAQIQQLRLENRTLVDRADNLEEQNLALKRTHARELDNAERGWREKLARERSINRRLYDTITSQGEKIETLKLNLASEREHQSASAKDLQQKVQFLQGEYSRVLRALEETRRGDQLSSDTADIDSTTELLKMTEPGPQTQWVRTNETIGPDSTTDFLIRANGEELVY